MNVVFIRGKAPDTIVYLTPNAGAKGSYFSDDLIWLGTHVSIQGNLSITRTLPYSRLPGTPNLSAYAPLASPVFTGTLTANVISSASGQELSIRSSAAKTTNIRRFTNGNVAVASFLTNHIGTQNLILRPSAGRDLVCQIDTGSAFNDCLRINRSTGAVTVSTAATF